jgi:hypothetical protein
MMSASLALALHRAHKERPAEFRADLPGQAEFMAARERRVIWFGHNGCGKSEGLARRLVRVFSGQDPICREARRPLTLILCVTGYDAVSCRDLADQLHTLLPPGLVAQQDLDERGRPIGTARSWYARGKGFRGRPPRLVVQRGPMARTTMNVTTLGAGQGAAAGGTIDLVIVNEPISRELYEELGTRDRADALGYLWYALTPIEGAPSQVWIPGLVEDYRAAGGSIRYIQTRLSRETLTFPSGRSLESWEGKTLPRIASWSPTTRPMRMGESLEPIFEDAYFAQVWRDSLVVDSVPPGVDLWLVGSLDHSLAEGRMRVGVTGYQVQGPASARRLVAWDLVDVKATSARIDEAANLFLDALDEAGIEIGQIDQWIGDRSTADRRHLVRRDNNVWKGAVLLAMRTPRRAGGRPPASIKAPRALWEIVTPSKHGGSSDYLMAQLRSAMAEEPPRLRFLRRCRHVIEDVQRWDGSKASPHKDGLDRVGYSWEMAHRHFGLWRG